MNREIVIPGGAGIYPLQGDVASQAGNSTVTVTGIQSIPVKQGVPGDGDALLYVQADNQWEPGAIPGVNTHSESLTDDNANFIFAATLTTGGDIITVVGVPN